MRDLVWVQTTFLAILRIALAQTRVGYGTLEKECLATQKQLRSTALKLDFTAKVKIRILRL